MTEPFKPAPMKPQSVAFGLIPRPAGRFTPFFAVSDSEGIPVEFLCNVSFETEEIGVKFVMQIHKILSGEQKNLKYDRKGNAHL